MEVKTKGDIKEAVNQACGVGTSMVEAYRQLEVLARCAASKTKSNNTANATKAITTPAKATSSAVKINATPNNSITNANPTVSKVSKGAAGSKVKGNGNTSTADFSTKAYTLVLIPEYAQINVHWIEIGEGEGAETLTYHMHCIKSYALNELDNLEACRAAVNNILDWGLGERDKRIKVLLNQIHDGYKALKATKGTGKGKDKCLDRLPASKKRRTDKVDTGDNEAWQDLYLP